MSRLYGNTGLETVPEYMLPTARITAGTYPRGFLQESMNCTGPARYLD